jgi:hypothetical protein
VAETYCPLCQNGLEISKGGEIFIRHQKFWTRCPLETAVILAKILQFVGLENVAGNSDNMKFSVPFT